MKRKERVENNFTKRIHSVLNDYVFRTFISSTLSFFITIAFAGYNVFLWFAYGAVWNIGIAVYYALLIGIRAYILFSEKKLNKSNMTDKQTECARKKLFFIQSIFLFAIGFALIVPISLMVMQEKEVHYTTIPAITIAVYTTYKIIISTRNYIKNRKQQNLSVQMLKNINFIDSIVSVLSLQYTLLMTFGNGVEGKMFTLCAITSFVLWALSIVVAVSAIVKSIKLKRY